MSGDTSAITILAYLAGGIGFFLLGMHMMTEGLKIAAGKALRTILAQSTRSPLRALLSGCFITSVVQSSSAVTVATIGFVNAGLLTLAQAVMVIFGSNVGTTMTGWLVALLGFHVDLQAMALPAVGIGMFMRVFSRNDKRIGYGEALTGFGVLFLGIDLLKTAFAGFGTSIDPQMFVGDGIAHLILFAAFGFLMTVLMQSSSAAMALTLTAAGSGVIPIDAAATMIIGANLGTTSTAALAVIGATASARRAAASHVLFNLITGLVAIITLPIWLWLIAYLSKLLGAGETATLLALFHTTFNILGVALMWPLTGRMVAWLQTQFRETEEQESTPRYIDATLIATPELALHALHKETSRIAAMARNIAEDAISTEASISRRLQQEREVMVCLTEEIGSFASRLRQQHLSEQIAADLPKALAAARYFIDTADLAHWIDQAQGQTAPTLPEALQGELDKFRGQAVTLLESMVEEPETFSSDRFRGHAEELHKQYNLLKSKLLQAGTSSQVPVRQVVELVELMKMTDRMVKQFAKGMVELSALGILEQAMEKAPAEPEPVVVEEVDAVKAEKPAGPEEPAK